MQFDGRECRLVQRRMSPYATIRAVQVRTSRHQFLRPGTVIRVASRSAFSAEAFRMPCDGAVLAVLAVPLAHTPMLLLESAT